MHLLRTVFHWYIKASIHVSLALVSLVLFSGKVMDVEISGHYVLSLFFGSVAAYNGIKYGLEPRKHTYAIPGGLRNLTLFSIGCLVFSLYHLSFLPIRTWLLILACGVITSLYALPVIPGTRNLRSIGLLKVFLVALVWTLASLWVPVWGELGAGSWDLQVESFQRLVWVFLLMLPFEIRDMHVDPPSLQTIPQRWGIGGTRRIAWAGVLLFIGASWLKDSPVPGELLSKSLTGLLMWLAVVFSTERKKRYFASFWVEGIPVVALLLLCLFGR